MASAFASLITIVEYDDICSCPDLASHTSYVGEAQTISLKHLMLRLTAESLSKAHRLSLED